MIAKVSYSVVAPVFDESPNLAELCRRLSVVLTALAGADWEIVLVDDGSRDGSWAEMERLHRADARIVGLRFSRNFGHHIALMAGLDVCRGERVVTMDSDLQDQPEEIAKLAAKMDEGYDLVFAERMHRQHGKTKRAGSRGFLWLLNWAADVPYPITGAVFRIMNRRFVLALRQLRERHRLFTGLTSWLGFKQTSVEVEHGSRYAGEPKYGPRRMLRLAADSVTAFSAKPLYYAVYLGIAASLFAVLFVAYVVIRHFVTGFTMVGWASIMTCILFFGGANLVVLGVIGQYVGRIFEEQKGRPVYIVQEQLGGDRPPASDI